MRLQESDQRYFISFSTFELNPFRAHAQIEQQADVLTFILDLYLFPMILFSKFIFQIKFGKESNQGCAVRQYNW